MFSSLQRAQMQAFASHALLAGTAGLAALPALAQACTQVHTRGGSEVVLWLNDTAREGAVELDAAPLLQALVRRCSAQADQLEVDCACTSPLRAVHHAATGSVQGTLYANLSRENEEGDFAACSAPLLSAYVVAQGQPSAKKGLTAGQVGLVVILCLVGTAVGSVFLHACGARGRARPSRRYAQQVANPFSDAYAQSAPRVHFAAEPTYRAPAIPLRSYAGSRRQSALQGAAFGAGAAPGYPT